MTRTEGGRRVETGGVFRRLANLLISTTDTQVSTRRTFGTHLGGVAPVWQAPPPTRPPAAFSGRLERGTPVTRLELLCFEACRRPVHPARDL
jgi:hypothetical protein